MRRKSSRRLLQSPTTSRLAAQAMKFKVSHPAGMPHQVELQAKVAVLGRDPSCDLVLNDAKCSRRHAVLEEGPEGLVIRDAGSANGIYVNGRRLERSRLRPGDTVTLGDVTLTLLDEDAATVVVAPGDLELGPEPSLPPSAPLEPTPPAPLLEPLLPASPGHAGQGTPEPPTAAPPAAAGGLPLTVALLSLLWGLAAPAWVAGGLLFAFRADEGTVAAVLAAGVGVVAGAFSGVMALGLRARAVWARHLQIASATLGLLICPFVFASATVLLYMLRPDVRRTFEGAPGEGSGGAGAAEPTFALSLLGMLALGLALAAGAALLISGG